MDDHGTRENPMRCTSFLITGFLVGATMLSATMPASAQPKDSLRLPDPATDPAKSSRYVPFPIDKDPEAFVRSHLDALKRLEPYKDFVDKIRRDPDRFKLDPELLKQLKLDDPGVQEKLKKWVDRDAKGRPLISPGQLNRLKEDVQKIIKEHRPEPKPPNGLFTRPDFVEPPPAPPQDNDATSRDWLKEIMERAEDSKIGEWLRESPVWRDVEMDLARRAGKQALELPDGAGWERLTGGLLKLDKLPTPDIAALAERLGKITPPNLPRWTGSLPSLPRPGLAAPAAPSLPTGSSVGTLAAWLLGLGLVALLAWQVSKRIGLPEPRRDGTAAVLGPWPVDPQDVATRAQLVQAFDYFALRRLGMSASAWNHHTVARALAARNPLDAPAVTDLAGLYEHARYTEGDDLLRADERDCARRALLQLVEVDRT
jgi:hypothetical protein